MGSELFTMAAVCTDTPSNTRTSDLTMVGESRKRSRLPHTFSLPSASQPEDIHSNEHPQPARDSLARAVTAGYWEHPHVGVDSVDRNCDILGLSRTEETRALTRVRPDDHIMPTLEMPVMASDHHKGCLHVMPSGCTTKAADSTSTATAGEDGYASLNPLLLAGAREQTEAHPSSENRTDVISSSLMRSSSDVHPGLSTRGSGSCTLQRAPDLRYKGVRLRSWGAWVTEAREPLTKQRVWLGSYPTAEGAARVYDMALLLLQGAPAARLNFPLPEQHRPVVVQSSVASALLRAAQAGWAARQGDSIGAAQTGRVGGGGEEGAG